MILTDGGDYALQRKAKLMQLWLEGVLTDSGAYALSRDIFVDACLASLGLLKIFPDMIENKVCVERVLRSDLSVDPHDARGGKPRTLFQHMSMAREVLGAQYGTKLDAVIGAKPQRGISVSNPASVVDPVSVIEAWHLRSGPKADDGRHVICTNSGKPLVDEGWELDRHPFASWRWGKQPLGWDGVPMADELLPYQEAYDYLTDRIDAMLEATKLRVGFEKNSKIDMDAFDSKGRESGAYTFNGRPPVITQDPGPPVALLMERERIKNAAFEQIGLSLLTAQSQLPRQLESAVAQQEYKDTESQRFQDVGQAWEEFFCGPGGVAELIMDAADQLPGDLLVRPRDGKVTRAVKWSEIKSIRNDMRVGVYPSSFFPREPAGRIERIQALSQVAPIPPSMLARMIDHPDVEYALSYATASEDAVLADLELLEDGQGVTPEPFLDVELATGMALSHYNKLRAQGAPEKTLGALRAYLLSLADMKASMVRGAGQVAGAGAPESVAAAALMTPGVEGTFTGPAMSPGVDVGTSLPPTGGMPGPMPPEMPMM
jgi:hypothetical protein